MNAAELYKSGELDAAVTAQVQDVKANPLDQSKRLFLFELVAFSGDLDRARRQIDVLKYEDQDLELAAMGYRKLLDSEQARRDLFAKGVPPGFFGEPSEHLRLRLEAVQRLRANAVDDAAELLGRAAEATPPVSGTINGLPFDEFRDADDLFGGVIEIMAQGRYFWAGIEQVRLVAMNPPRFPRDLLYIPANLELDTESGEVHLPSLYPGSHESPDDRIKLARLTDWKSLHDNLTLGVGVHTFLHGEEAISLLEWREYRSAEA
jgi:type VI secretion system protein ImpE